MSSAPDRQIENPVEREEALLSLRVAGLPIDPRIAVYSTIILMSGLALLDFQDTELSWSQWAKVFGAAFAPVAAVAVAHAFADALGYEVRTQTRLDAKAMGHIVRHNIQFFYVAVITLVILAPSLALNVAASTAANILMIIGTANLVGWGTFAGRRVGLGWRGVLIYALAYGFVGVIVVLVKYWLTH
jgi:hypothetical protein